MPSAAPLCPPPPPLLLLLLLVLLSGTAGAQLVDEPFEEELTPRALRDFYPKRPNLTTEKQLVRLKSVLRVFNFCFASRPMSPFKVK